MKTVEYAGTGFSIQLVDDRGSDLTALVSEPDFRGAPISEGERVTATWASEAAHVLEGGARYACLGSNQTRKWGKR